MTKAHAHAPVTAPAPQKPPITVEGIKRLLVQLDKDLVAVKASAADAPLKAQTESLVTKLKAILLNVIGMDPTNVGEWVKVMGPQFSQLTNNIKKALGAAAPGTGACSYTNPDGCINATSAQCEELGGSFAPGADCP